MLTFEQTMKPIWETDTVYAESFTMVKDQNGNARAPFLYPPLKILGVTNATFTETYEEGKDFIIENNCIVLTENSRIFAFTEKEVYEAEPIPDRHFPHPTGNLLYGEANFYHRHQICATYTCAPGGWTGIRPEIAAEKLPRTFEKLHSGTPLTAVVFGDSISAGANASKNSNTEPFQPPYATLFIDGLRKHFSGCDITFHNPSVGGKNAIWGEESTKERVCVHKPDFVVIAFGMNDGGRDSKEFANNIRGIMRQVREVNADAEFILVATSTPNPILTDPRAKFFNGQHIFKEVLDEIAADPIEGKGVAVANIRDMQAFLHSKKRFIDTTGNNVNHPNDFFYRLYAQYLCGMFY